MISIYKWQQLELFDIGFASKDVNKIHYFSSNDIFYPTPLCDRDISSDDFIHNYNSIIITEKNQDNICDICLAEYLRLLDRKFILQSVSKLIIQTSAVH